MYVEVSVWNQLDMGFVLLWMKVISFKKVLNILGDIIININDIKKNFIFVSD